jgi:riboflavin biosynthesis pyrimidine reductase
MGAELLALPAPLDLGAALKELHRRRGVRRLLVEGGGTLNGSLHEAGLIDQVEVHLGPLVIGGAGAPGPVMGRGAGSLAEAAKMEIVRYEAAGGGLRLVALPPGEAE